MTGLFGYLTVNRAPAKNQDPLPEIPVSDHDKSLTRKR